MENPCIVIIVMRQTCFGLAATAYSGLYLLAGIAPGALKLSVAAANRSAVLPLNQSGLTASRPEPSKPTQTALLR
tara:strand:+ start:2458 stop:2682 length:225 start_codon:yes stop_codon:yes gene_type:complete